jgi:hypothetical protein
MSSDLAARPRFANDFVPVVRPGSVVRHYDTEAVAWSSNGAGPALLDAVSAVVIQIVDGGATVADLVEDVHAALGVGTDVARARILRALGVLDDAGLLETSTSVEMTLDDLDLFHFPPNT